MCHEEEQLIRKYIDFCHDYSNATLIPTSLRDKSVALYSSQGEAMGLLHSREPDAYLYNPYRQENLAFSLQMHLAGKELYGDLMRRIYVRGYCFNLNKMPRSSLIEVGAQTNTVAEAKNAMVPLGAILYKVLIAQE